MDRGGNELSAPGGAAAPGIGMMTGPGPCGVNGDTAGPVAAGGGVLAAIVGGGASIGGGGTHPPSSFEKAGGGASDRAAG
jgi:hypothetical protein